jgi:hypothetical protein
VTLTSLAALRSLTIAKNCIWWLVVALAGVLVVAHGCHGNEDHELIARAAAVAK